MKKLIRYSIRGLYAALFLVSLPVVSPAVESAMTSTATSTVPGEKQTVEDVIPLTMGNLRGHKMLYNEGWYIVTSSSKALDFAEETFPHPFHATPWRMPPPALGDGARTTRPTSPRTRKGRWRAASA